jgi:hypothetical protein
MVKVSEIQIFKIVPFNHLDWSELKKTNYRETNPTFARFSNLDVILESVKCEKCKNKIYK